MKKINFTGNFGEFLLSMIGLTLLSIITCGLGSIYMAYWIPKYVVNRVEIDGQKLIFRGSFWPYFGMLLLCSFLCIPTLGISFIYFAYWTYKYFIENSEVLS